MSDSDSNAVTGKLEAKQLMESVKSFKVTNDELVKLKHKTEGLNECTRLCDVSLSLLLYCLCDSPSGVYGTQGRISTLEQVITLKPLWEEDGTLKSLQ